MKGNLRCPLCNGRGGSFRSGRFYPCDCTRMSQGRRAAQREASQASADAARRIAERLRREQEGQ